MCVTDFFWKTKIKQKWYHVLLFTTAIIYTINYNDLVLMSAHRVLQLMMMKTPGMGFALNWPSIFFLFIHIHNTGTIGQRYFAENRSKKFLITHWSFSTNFAAIYRIAFYRTLRVAVSENNVSSASQSTNVSISNDCYADSCAIEIYMI